MSEYQVLPVIDMANASPVNDAATPRTCGWVPPVQPERLMPVVAVVVGVLPALDVELVLVDVVFHEMAQQPGR